MAFPTGAVNEQVYFSKYGTRYVYDSSRNAWVQRNVQLYGSAGAQGLTGPQNITGTQGATGAQGYIGAQGSTGIQGTTGVGQQGVTGPAGVSPTVPGSTGPYGSSTGIISMTFDGNGSYLVPGVQTSIKMPWTISLDGWQVVSQETGYASVDVAKASYDTWPVTTTMNSGDTGPYLSRASKNEDTDLTGWAATSVSSGQYLQFLVTGVTGIGGMTVSVGYHRT